MTQEEKAKAYDKSYKTAENIHRFSSDPAEIKRMEEIFPALKESEDEKIKKALIHFFSNSSNTSFEYWEGIPKKEVLAFLEKQGEPNWCHHSVDLSDCSEEYKKAYYDGWNNCNMQHSQCELEKSDVLKCLINGMKFYYEDNENATWGTEKFSMKVKDILAWLEKQVQKPANKVEPKFKVGQTIKKEGFNLGFTIVKIEDGFYYNNTGDHFPFTDQDNWELVEQEPAWSEEDTNMLGSILSTLDICSYNPDISADVREIHKKEEAWLSELYSRIVPQPKQEWSEEDEEHIKSLLERLEGMCKKDATFIRTKFAVSEDEDWLKSLRHLKQWRPSDEQMQHLSDVVHKAKYKNDISVGGYPAYMPLVSLYLDLKKLKG